MIPGTGAVGWAERLLTIMEDGMASFGTWLAAQNKRQDEVGDLSRWWESQPHAKVHSLSGITNKLREREDWHESRMDQLNLASEEFRTGRVTPSLDQDWRDKIDGDVARIEGKLDALLLTLGIDNEGAAALLATMAEQAQDTPAATAEPEPLTPDGWQAMWSGADHTAQVEA